MLAVDAHAIAQPVGDHQNRAALREILCLLQQIDARLNPIISQVMTQRGANLAMDVGATYAHAPALNVTDAVLQLLNQQLPAVTVAPLPQQAQPAPQPGR